MDIPQIIFEEGIEFGDEETYNKFIIYCEWYLFDGNIDELDNELCLTFRELCSLYVEPNYIDRLQKNE
jgi:hypothetical protein